MEVVILMPPVLTPRAATRVSVFPVTLVMVSSAPVS